jgi:hypothetical protein
VSFAERHIGAYIKALAQTCPRADSNFRQVIVVRLMIPVGR